MILINITFLDLSYCKKLTDEGFSYISTLTKITTLDISQCKKLTDIGLIPLLSQLTTITTLNLNNNNNFTTTANGDDCTD